MLLLVRRKIYFFLTNNQYLPRLDLLVIGEITIVPYIYGIENEDN